MYVKDLGASTDDLKFSKASYATFNSRDEPARRGGEEGGVSVLRSSDLAQTDLLNV